MNSIIIRHTDNAQKIIETLKAKGQLKTSVVLEKDIELKRIVGIDTDIVFIEAENNYSTLIAVTTFLGWKKFRLFAFDLTDGIDYANSLSYMEKIALKASRTLFLIKTLR